MTTTQHHHDVLSSSSSQEVDEGQQQQQQVPETTFEYYSDGILATAFLIIAILAAKRYDIMMILIFFVLSHTCRYYDVCVCVDFGIFLVGWGRDMMDKIKMNKDIQGLARFSSLSTAFFIFSYPLFFLTHYFFLHKIACSQVGHKEVLKQP